MRRGSSSSVIAPAGGGRTTLVETAGHNADALTGADGCPSERYLEQHFQFHHAIRVRDVDVFTVDTWIEEEQGGAS
jgi:hypothetical protein